MIKSKQSESFAEGLMSQDVAVSGSQYESHRNELEAKLESAERRERIAYRVCMVTGVVSFSLMFVGGSRVLGSFDPWSDSATLLSIILGTIYLVSTIVFWVLLASYYSRLRPRSRKASEHLRDEQLKHLERQIKELREIVVSMHESAKTRADDAAQNTDVSE